MIKSRIKQRYYCGDWTCIAQKSYEVEKEFKDKFVKKNKRNSVFLKLKKKIYFNLVKFIHYQLISFGIIKIDVIRKDTFDKKNNFFSARRSLKNNEPDYGRNISVIMLRILMKIITGNSNKTCLKISKYLKID